MPYANSQYPLQQETGAIIGLAMEVHNTLGSGFLEAVYQEALQHELTNHGIPFENQKCYHVPYKDTILKSKYLADLVVFDKVIVEIKARKEISNVDMAQIINYLKCSGCEVGLILNFGADKLGMKRMVL